MKRVLLGDIAKISSGGTPDRSNPAYWSGDIPWVKTGEIQFGVIWDAEEKISAQALKESSAKLVPAGSLLMAMYGQGKTRGQVALLGIEAAINQACAAISPHDADDSKYLFQFFAANYENVRRLSNSGSQENLNAELIRGIPLFYPAKHQRQRIADILSTWDEALEKLDALIAAKERRKQALMQQLLTGRRRLPGFSKPWKQTRFGDLMRSEDRYADFDDDHIYHLISARRRAEGVVFREALHGRNIKTKVMKQVRAGDLVISRMQVVHGGLGVVPLECDGYYASDSYEVLVPRDPTKLSPRFIGHLCRSRRFWHHALVCSHGVHIEKMTFVMADFEHENFMIPEFVEQVDIADVLDTSDTELRLLRDQRAAVDQQKRGLMQKLLTGKVRVST